MRRKFFILDEEMAKIWDELYFSNSKIKKEKELLKLILKFVQQKQKEFNEFVNKIKN